jgi:hypothetical protein
MRHAGNDLPDSGDEHTVDPCTRVAHELQQRWLVEAHLPVAG